MNRRVILSLGVALAASVALAQPIEYDSTVRSIVIEGHADLPTFSGEEHSDATGPWQRSLSELRTSDYSFARAVASQTSQIGDAYITAVGSTSICAMCGGDPNDCHAASAYAASLLDIDFHLVETRSAGLSGELFEAHFDGAAGTVEVVLTYGDEVVFSASEQGAFEFEDVLEAGAYTLTIRAEGSGELAAAEGELAACGADAYYSVVFHVHEMSCTGDVDGDGDVDLADLAALLESYGACAGDEDYRDDADFDGSGCIDIVDLATLLSGYGCTESDDCNGNGIPDWLDIHEGISADCNANGIPDECDIAEGVSEDCQPNGVPDECGFAELFVEDQYAHIDYWLQRPLPTQLIEFPLVPTATPSDYEAAELLKAGIFQPWSVLPPLDIGVPPPWDINPYDSNTWDLCRHSLGWMAPLVRAWYASGDQEALDLVIEIIEDWWLHNREYPGASPYAWNDFGSAGRMQQLVWFWELYRTSDEIVDEQFATTMLEMLSVHGRFCADDRFYGGHSNHGLACNVALTEVTAVYPEFCHADEWATTLHGRMEEYIEENFSSLGFHYEQSAFYHFFVLDRLSVIMLFVREFSELTIPGLEDAMYRITSVAPYLVRTNRRMVNIGDSRNHAVPLNYFEEWIEWWDGAWAPAEATLPNPREDDCSFVLDFEGGYATFATYPILETSPPYDGFVVYKCRAYPFSHYHRDALSFVFWGQGHDWIIDSGGAFRYDDCPERSYIISSRAHNVVLVDGADFELGTCELLGYGRTDTHDFVTVRHDHAAASQTRTLAFYPPYTVEVTDVMSSNDGSSHLFSQLLHTYEEYDIEVVDNRHLNIRSQDGKQCTIEQLGVEGEWSIITGQVTPFYQGWYTPAMEELDPAPAIYYTTTESLESCTFSTRLTIEEVE